MIDILSKEQCTGCSVCVDVCPVRAISIHSDSEGFGYPKIDMGTCIRCNLCEKNVRSFMLKIEKNDYVDPICYAGYSKIQKFVLKVLQGEHSQL